VLCQQLTQHLQGGRITFTCQQNVQPRAQMRSLQALCQNL
jgi:hypothetical protein